MEKYQMLVVSTAHVSRGVMNLFDMDTSIFSNKYGVVLSPYTLQEYGKHECVKALHDFAIRNNCKYVMLDRDASVNDTLTEYDW